MSALVLDVGAFFVEEALAAIRAEELEFFVVAQLFGVRAELSRTGRTGYPKEFRHRKTFCRLKSGVGHAPGYTANLPIPDRNAQ